jgi:hypothetical protein
MTTPTPAPALCACQRAPARPGQRDCRDCHAAWMRFHRPPYSSLSPEARRRANMRAHTNVLIRRGSLVPQPCACGTTKVLALHRTYTDPRDVAWACATCAPDVRRQIERALRKLAEAAA